MAEKNIKNTHPGAAPEPRSIVNNQSSIINLEIPCSADPLQPVPLIPRFPLLSLSSAFCILSSVFCLLYSVFCLLSSASCLLSKPPSLPRIHESIMQNKPNVKIGNINTSTARTKAYAKEQRTMNNERYPKQTQSNPIPPPRRFTLHEIRHTTYEPNPPPNRRSPAWNLTQTLTAG